MNILIIEDDAFLAEKIWKIFESKVISNRVRILHSFEQFMRESTTLASYDIVLTDLKLLDASKELCGYKVIRTIRAQKLTIPIVVISGMSDIDRLREAFDHGASDYLVKPLRLKELELRVSNWFKNYQLSKLTSAWKGNIYHYKDLSYHLDKNEFYFKDTRIPLTKNNKYILSLFFTSPESLLKESFLVEKIWGDLCLSVDRNLRVSILRLKNSLTPFGIDGWIRNVRGEGYVFSDRDGTRLF